MITQLSTTMAETNTQNWSLGPQSIVSFTVSKDKLDLPRWVKKQDHQEFRIPFKVTKTKTRLDYTGKTRESTVTKTEHETVSFVDLPDNDKVVWEQSTVGAKIQKQFEDKEGNLKTYSTNEQIVKPDVRDSQYAKVELPPYSIIPNAIYKGIKTLVPESCRHMINKIQSHYTLQLQMLKYEEGGHFSKHTDTVRSKAHFATVLIMFPGIDHEGGDLTVWDHEGTAHVFSSSTITKPTVVAFHPHLAHELSPVTSGTRIIFKTTWNYDRSLFNFTNATYQDIVIPSEIRPHESHLQITYDRVQEEMNQEMADIQTKIVCSQTDGTPVDINDMINNLKNAIKQLKQLNGQMDRTTIYDIPSIIEQIQNAKKKFALIVLPTYYDIGRKGAFDFMYQQDQELLITIKQHYPGLYCRNIVKATSNSEYGSDRDEWEDFGRVFNGDYEYDEAEKIFDTIYVTNLRSSGNVSSTEEYNDEGYDHVTLHTFTCVIIRKDDWVYQTSDTDSESDSDE